MLKGSEDLKMVYVEVKARPLLAYRFEQIKGLYSQCAQQLPLMSLCRDVLESEANDQVTDDGKLVEVGALRFGQRLD